ncbi:MAG: hypothetical protein JXO72_04785 [Vicinamibacteria bacterium]|nr:hypothetical protein [Vicinamibacteria bacterium]
MMSRRNLPLSEELLAELEIKAKASDESSLRAHWMSNTPESDFTEAAVRLARDIVFEIRRLQAENKRLREKLCNLSSEASGEESACKIAKARIRLRGE